MKNVSLVAACSVALLFTACSSGGGKINKKKIVIMASGKITVADKTITVDPSLTHNEQTIDFTDDKMTLTVKSTAGTSKTFDLTDNGVYLLNLQTDTLTGGVVNYGNVDRPGSITEQQLDHIIDSTVQLINGTNASDARGTYFLPPFTLKKINDKDNTRVIGAFKGIPYKIEADENGQIPTVVKFFSNKQKRETLNDLMIQRAKIKNMPK